jgi:hypothetical protein
LEGLIVKKYLFNIVKIASESSGAPKTPLDLAGAVNSVNDFCQGLGLLGGISCQI